MKGGNVHDVLERHKTELMTIPGVIGVAEGRCDGRPCIRIFVIKKATESESRIPSRIEGFPVSLEETGEFSPVPE